MSASFTKSTARNIFYGGSVFFFLLFLGLTLDTTMALPGHNAKAQLTDQAIRGKKIWESRNCGGCHTLLGEGAFFGPELGNVYVRRGPDFIKGWMQAMPTNTPGRRQMPQFHLNDVELDDLVAFLKYTSQLNSNNWPPNIEG
ncbi:cytochrome c [Laribacter hongkongensis]|uniref:Cytochrome C n=2 Tax=Laribacter hongkongensis TaxID=168471 RepID=A0A248LHV9_9NEIS|nr:cytochrome C [Laribacter hongkongensis]MCG9042028.1 cytochrome c [Laribacter hongkongensis]MCG9069064.1 cytochrome c [Laribacter hongkongensis]MCG9083871.1 cytochrome c [Laribacter hongkongensis]MCG9087871.1 cytochrome c [Laribacter hongkongensis]